MSCNPIQVAAGVIFDGHKVLIAKRPLDKPEGGLWEFPGGKLDSKESARQALVRELKEELNITVQDAQVYLPPKHSSVTPNVILHFFKILNFHGVATGNEGQLIRWVAIRDLPKYDFPKANQVVLEQLTKDFL